MSDRTPEFEFQALDTNGDPLPGAKLNFYITGTSTRKDTYSDSAKTVVNANPVVADAAGRFGDIFMDIDQQYRVVYTDAADVVIKTRDNVSPTRGSIVTSTPIIQKSANFTVLVSERGSMFEVDASSGSVNAALLPVADAKNGFEITIKKIDSSANAVTVDGNGAETIDGATTQALSVQYAAITIVCDGTEWHVKSENDPVLISLPQSYLAGLGLKNDGTDADHDIVTAIGECRDTANGVNITLAAAMIKQIDATWAAGTNQGGMSNSLFTDPTPHPRVDTWYHLHAIVVGGNADVGFDTSINAANLIADHGATAYRRIGSVKTDGSSNILAFLQIGDRFYWDVSKPDIVDADPGTSAVIATLPSIPTGYKVPAIMSWGIEDDSVSATTFKYVKISDPDLTAVAPSNSDFTTSYAASSTGNNELAPAYGEFMTDASAQIRYQVTESAADITVRGMVHGWIDRRGRDD